MNSHPFSKDLDQIKARILKAGETSPTKAVPLLIRHSVHPNAHIRRAVAAELKEFKYPTALEILLPLLTDRRAEVRSAAVVTLGHFESSAIFPIVESMAHDQSRKVRRTVSKMLLDLKERSSIDTLVIGALLVQDEDVETAGRAFQAINELKLPHEIKQLSDEVVEATQKFHPGLYSIHKKSEAKPEAFWESISRKKMEEKVGPPGPQFYEIAENVSARVQENRSRQLYGLWSAMIISGKCEEGSVNFISCLDGYEYRFSVVISPETILEADRLGELPERMDGTALAAAIIPDHECLILAKDESPVKPLILPARGHSAAAHFKLRGIKPGQSRLQVLLYHKGCLLIRGYTSPIEIIARRGKVERCEKRSLASQLTGIVMDHGEDLADIAKNMQRERFASLLIDKDESTGKLLFALFCHNGGKYIFRTASIPFKRASGVSTYVRERLQRLINDKGSKFRHVFFRSNITFKIGNNSVKRAVASMKKTGTELFACLFLDPDMEPLREQLIALVTKSPQDGILQVVSDEVFLPWQLMYADDQKRETDISRFWGMRFQIEHTLAGGVGLRSWNMGQGEEPMICFINTSLPEITVKAHTRLFTDKKTTEKAVLEDFTRRPNKRPAFYFYCHANFNSEDPNECWIKLTDDHNKLTLLDLQTKTAFDSEGKQLDFACAPLVFLNACESGRIEPSFYQSFVGFLLRDKKAGGVIGTESVMPAFFAAHFAEQFWSRIIKNKIPVGQVLFELRKYYWQQFKNPLAMLYSLYTNAEKMIGLGI